MVISQAVDMNKNGMHLLTFSVGIGIMARGRFLTIRALLILIAVLMMLAVPSRAANIPKDELKSLDEQVQEIKKDVLSQTAELRRLEEKLLFPSNTQVSLFISLDDKKSSLESVELKLDNKVVAKYLYNMREQTSLKKGGVQRIYTGNIKTGEHELQVNVSVKASSDGRLQRNARYTLTKKVGPKFLEIKIADSGNIKFQDW